MRLQDSSRKASYNDLQVQRTVKEQKQKERMERTKREQVRKQQEMKDLKTEIKELKDKGNSVREIAKILGISKSKVGRLV